MLLYRAVAFLANANTTLACARALRAFATTCSPRLKCDGHGRRGPGFWEDWWKPATLRHALSTRDVAR
ncbi:hypothetical protein GY45DRAFT_1332680 [Cubamyces sp. BRFM 1775]|nr:hypothetical protein GY45DRAFT_1332680 [Cubamyces sp. BRFM 1775]